MEDIQSVRIQRLIEFITRNKKTLIITALLIISLVATGFVWARKQVNITVDGKNMQITTSYSNPLDVLTQAGVTLGPQDEYRLTTKRLAEGSTIEVYRAVQVAITYQGRTRSRLTGKPTVAEFVQSMGIPLSNIEMIPDGQTRPTAGMRIKVVEIREEIRQEKREIPFTVFRKPDPTLESGIEEVEQAGKPGMKLVTVKVKYADGVETVKKDIAEKVLQVSTPKVVRSGTRNTLDTSRGTIRFKSVRWMEATAYLPTDGSPEGLTATGIAARRGIVAVDPDVIPLGTRVYVPGYGFALAADTGGAIIGDRIDLCIEDYDEAWDFGRKQIKVYILDN